MTLREQIKVFFKGDVDDDAATLEAHSRDASIFRLRPRLVVFPKDVVDICNLVKFVRKQKEEGHHISLTARAAGTDMSGGPLTTSIAMVCTRYLNRIKEVGDDYAVVEPGMYYRDFEAETLKSGLLMPSYPASRELCAVGGMVANNSGGEKTLAYGKVENYVRQVRMVLDDGEEYPFAPMTLGELEAKKRQHTVEGDVYRKLAKLVFDHSRELQQAKPQVSKNSTGYSLWNVWDAERSVFDPTKVIVGSQGTLGIITEITFRLVRPKVHSRMLVVYLRSLEPLVQIVNRVLRYKPESFESYDDHTFRMELKLFPQLVRHLRGNIFSLAWQFLPEFKMMLMGGIPKMVLIAEFTAGSAAEAEAQARKAEESVRSLGCKTKVTHSEDEGVKYWVMRRESFNVLRQQVHGLRTAPFIDDFVVRPDVLPKFLPQLYKILDQHKIVYTVAGHVGDGNFHIIPLMDMTRPESLTVIKKLSRQVYELVFQFKGSMSGEHNDGLIRGPYLEEMYGEKVYSLFVETKNIFDPLGIFNPGKKTGVNISYTMAHVDTRA